MIWLIWLAFIVEEAYRNYYTIEVKKNYIKHGVEAIIHVCVSIAIIIIVDPETWIHVLCWFVGGFFSFWLIFNILLNAFRGKPFGYVGKNAILDRIESFSPSILFNVFAKAVLAIGFIYGYYNVDLF